jgi:hypothetical protein
MPFDRIQDARRARDAEAAAARNKAREQQDALRRGYRSTGWESVAPSTRARVADHPVSRGEAVPYKPGPPPNAREMGGALDDPNTKIEVGPDGVVRRSRLKE